MELGGSWSELFHSVYQLPVCWICGTLLFVLFSRSQAACTYMYVAILTCVEHVFLQLQSYTSLDGKLFDFFGLSLFFFLPFSPFVLLPPYIGSPSRTNSLPKESKMKRWKRRFSESFLRPSTSSSRDETPSPSEPAKATAPPRIGRPASLILQGSSTVSGWEGLRERSRGEGQ